MINSLFSSPERLLNVMSRKDMQEEKDDGERILIDEDGGASVNIHSSAVQEDFIRHVNALRHASNHTHRSAAEDKSAVERNMLRSYPHNEA